MAPNILESSLWDPLLDSLLALRIFEMIPRHMESLWTPGPCRLLKTRQCFVLQRQVLQQGILWFIHECKLYRVCFNLSCGCYNLFCNVWVCVWGGGRGCFGNMCTCVYCVLLLFVLCFLYCFVYVYLLLFVQCAIVKGLLPSSDN
jgi:hypothetical protein